jgi:hypothetical protein
MDVNLGHDLAAAEALTFALLSTRETRLPSWSRRAWATPTGFSPTLSTNGVAHSRAVGITAAHLRQLLPRQVDPFYTK